MMMYSTLVIVALVQSAAMPEKTADIYGGMAGEWVVDLSVEADKPYTQAMLLTINEDRTVSGEFYQSKIEQGRAGRNQGRICVSFQTSDGAGPYYHAACLVDGVMTGQSWAEHRSFVLPRSARRKPAE